MNGKTGLDRSFPERLKLNFRDPDQNDSMEFKLNDLTERNFRLRGEKPLERAFH